ncbi:hypothetical protein R6Q59_003070 [Mikania micrantha]
MSKIRGTSSLTMLFLMKKWALQLDQDTRHSRPEEGNEESGGSLKGSRTTEEGEYYANPNPETPTSSSSTSQHPIGRYVS